MNIRALNLDSIEEIEAVNKLAAKYNITVPADARIIIAVNDEGEIRAFAGLRPVITVTPFVSENPRMGKELFDHAEGYMKSLGYPLVQCITDPENEGLFNKLEFAKVFEGKIIMEKIF